MTRKDAVFSTSNAHHLREETTKALQRPLPVSSKKREIEGVVYELLAFLGGEPFAAKTAPKITANIIREVPRNASMDPNLEAIRSVLSAARPKLQQVDGGWVAQARHHGRFFQGRGATKDEALADLNTAIKVQQDRDSSNLRNVGVGAPDDDDGLF